jgi:tetratricopeptide (TPR) repeat protein
MNRLRQLIREAHRRSLWQVVAIYLGASWAVMQVVALVAGQLALPDWVTPVAILLLLIGLPIVVATAFVQEGMPSRRDPAPTPDGDVRSSHAPAAPAADVPTHRRLLSWRNAISAGVLAFALLGVVSAGYVGLRALGLGQADEALDARAVAVLPFRVTGDTALVWLREGVVDLLGAKLAGADGSRSVDSRATLIQWRRVADGTQDLSQDDARLVARRLGAGRFILGDVVDAGGTISLAVRLVDTSTGRVVQTARRDGAPDQALGLLDRVVAELLVREAGEDLGRIEALTSASLPAVQAYLAGLPAYRRGQFNEAARRFGEALAHDSTFTLAAFYLARSRSWIGYGPEYHRGLRLAWEGRDRLSERDRRHVVAVASARYPEPQPMPQRIRAYQELLDIAPDNVEAWHGYADILYHAGYPAGIPDADDRARRGFERALAIDPDYAPALHHLIELAAFDGDTATVRRLAARFDATAPAELQYLPWIIAEALEDSAALRVMYGAADTLRVGTLLAKARIAIGRGFGLRSAPRFLDIADRRSVTQQERIGAAFARMDFELSTGRPDAAMARLPAIQALVPDFDSDFTRLIFAISGQLHRDVGDATAARLLERLEAGRYQSPTGPWDAHCLLTVWLAGTGDVAAARSHAAALADRPTAEEPDAERLFEVCEMWANAAVTLASGSPDLQRRLDRLDAWLLEQHVWAGPREVITLWLARAWEESGDPERAFAAVRRLTGNAGDAPPRLLLEARLAERLGNRHAAIRAYQHFLSLFSDPEPGWPTDLRDEARLALARLLPA